jgi:hypothetical protein
MFPEQYHVETSTPRTNRKIQAAKSVNVDYVPNIHQISLLSVNVNYVVSLFVLSQARPTAVASQDKR